MTVLMTIYVIVRIKIVTGVNIRNRQGAGFGSWTWRLERKTGQTSKALVMIQKGDEELSDDDSDFCLSYCYI